MSARNSWRYAIGGAELQVELDGDRAVLVDPRSQPSRRELTLEEAFAAPHMLFVRDGAVLFEVVAAIAERLGAGEGMAPLHRKRLAFWQRYRPAALWAAEYPLPGREGRPRPVLELKPEGLWGPEPESLWDYRTLYLPDDAFFYGPPAVGMDVAARDDLRARLLGALAPGSGLMAVDGFPRFDHDRIERAEWAWNQSDDGGEDVVLAGGALSYGYRHQHDFGWSAWPVERVFTGAPELFLASIPAAVLAEVRERLSRAIIR